MKRREILNIAENCICRDRETQYGSPDANFAKIAALWEAYTNVRVTPEDVAVMMALLKVARFATGRAKEDHFIDAAGYLALAGELATTRERTIPK